MEERGPAVCRRVADELRAEQGSGLFDHLRSIGVDETSYKRGHTYMTVVVDHDRGRAVWMHQGHGGGKVFDLFFQTLTPERRASIQVVTGDGTRWIDECAFRWRPMTERILDGFHIVSWATDALDKVRTVAWCEARKTGVAAKGADASAPLLRRWAADAFLSGIPGFVPLGEKIARRHFDILRTIRSGLSNARLEAVNNRIKTTIKIGYGYGNLDNLIAPVMLKCGGLNPRLPGHR